MYLFPYSEAIKDKSVVIYGMGKVGSSYVKQVLSDDFCRIEFVTDSHWEKIKAEGVAIKPPEATAEGEWPVIIAVADVSAAEEIKLKLKTMGVAEERIIWNCNFRNDFLMLEEVVQSLAKNYFPPREKAADFSKVHPFKHYEAPYAELGYVRKHQAEIYDCQKEIAGIDFNLEGQKRLMSRILSLPLPAWSGSRSSGSSYRYYKDNGVFPFGDAAVLFGMLCLYRPKRVIEIGSGFSTAVMLDTSCELCDNSMSIECIEPYAGRLKALLRPDDNIVLHEDFLQNIPADTFDKLEENDILFIDSSHVAKTGSDVNYEIFEILPRLKPGVLIHFHDVFYPFEYPLRWIEEGRAYNEMFLLRAFLMYNRDYSVLCFLNQLKKLAQECFRNMGTNFGGGSLWLRKNNQQAGLKENL